MKRILSERNIVVILFVMVLVTFSFAQEDTKKIERMFLDSNSVTSQNESPESKLQLLRTRMLFL
ncbi:MAG: hypothetical protein WDO71_20655 [Bacteroidota bacterium]